MHSSRYHKKLAEKSLLQLKQLKVVKTKPKPKEEAIDQLLLISVYQNNYKVVSNIMGKIVSMKKIIEYKEIINDVVLYASKNKMSNIIMLILELIPDNFLYKKEDGKTPLELVCKNDRNMVEVAERMIPKISNEFYKNWNENIKKLIKKLIKKETNVSLIWRLSEKSDIKKWNRVLKIFINKLIINTNETESGDTILHLLINNKIIKSDLIIELIPSLSDDLINSLNNNNYSPLQLAIVNERSDLADKLEPLTSDIIINTENIYNETCLLLVCIKKYEKLAISLLNRMTIDKILLKSINNNSSLISALSKKLPDVSFLILKKILDSSIEIKTLVLNDIAPASLLHWGCLIGTKMIKFINLLLTEVSDEYINMVDKFGRTALYLACCVENMDEIILKLIPRMSHEAINNVSQNGETALMRACINYNQVIPLLLIPKMTDQAINQISVNGGSALIPALKNKLIDVSRILISRMSVKTINSIDRPSNFNSLKSSCDIETIEFINYLIDIADDENINLINNKNYTALSLLCKKGLIMEDLCLKLISKMSLRIILIKSNENKTALDYAIENNMTRVINEIENIKRDYIKITCNICYSDVLEMELTYLPCDFRHFVCDSCYNHLNQTSKKCPYCRTRF